MCDTIWYDYIRNVNYPKCYNCCDQSEIHCLVKMDDGEIWNAYWVTDFYYHGESFTGWKFLPIWINYRRTKYETRKFTTCKRHD